jgi:hypothetical protein
MQGLSEEEKLRERFVNEKTSASEVDAAANFPRLIAGVVPAVAITIYLVLVVAGYIPKDNHLGVAELGLAFVGCLFLVLAVYPKALDRLNLLKLPGGIEVTLEKIQRQQVEQRRELDAFFLDLVEPAEPSGKVSLALPCAQRGRVRWPVISSRGAVSPQALRPNR